MSLPYSVRLGGQAALDPGTGSVYVVKTVRPQFETVPPVTDGTSVQVGDMGIWIAKLDPTLACTQPDPDNPSLCWASIPVVTTNVAPISAVAFAPNGDLYVAGWGGDADLGTPGAHNPTNPGGRAAWVARFNGANGALVAWTWYGLPSGLSMDPKALHVGASGWVSVTGWTGRDLPTTSTAYRSALYGSQDGFVAVFNEDLSNVGGPDGDGLIYASILPGGSDVEKGLAVASDAGGRVWVGGFTSSADVDTSSFLGGHSSTFMGATDGFLLEIDPAQSGAASISWGTLFGGAGDDDVTGLALDGLGNVVVTGTTDSSGLSLQGSLRGGNDAWLATFAPGGTLMDGRYLGGKDADSGVAVRIDGAGRIVAAGSTQSRNFPVTASAYDDSHNSRKKDDVFVTRLDAAFTILDSTFLGGSSHDTCMDLHLDLNDVAYVAGTPVSADFPKSVATFEMDAFVAKLDFGSGEPPGGVTVDDIVPGQMTAGSTIAVSISGTDFVSGASVSFENGSGPTPSASQVTFVDPTRIDAVVTVGGGGRRGVRVWDVRVTNPDSSTGVLPGGFQVIK